MKKQAKISNAVIRRLPRYRRYLNELRKKGVDKISSNEFSNLIGYTASQIRQDLNNFGGFGQQGYGYYGPNLKKHIAKILGLDREYDVLIVASAGNTDNRDAAKNSGFCKVTDPEESPKIQLMHS